MLRAKRFRHDDEAHDALARQIVVHSEPARIVRVPANVGFLRGPESGIGLEDGRSTFGLPRKIPLISA